MVKSLLVKNQGGFVPELSQGIPTNGIITVGNDASATIELNDDAVAAEQFVIVCESDSATLMCRVDGTEINGEHLPQGALHNLQIGDAVTVGTYTFIIETPENAEALLAGKEIETTVNEPKVPVNSPEIVKSNGVLQNGAEKPERNLSAVLEGLRAEEKFYFLIEDKTNQNRRIYVETEEMWLGWANSGDCVLSSQTEEIDVPRAQIRKDWSGVVLYPLQAGNIWLNDQTLAEPHRLKNDDRLALSSKDNGKLCPETVIKFHEPTALLILDSILPKELPPPILLDNDGRLITDTSANRNITDESELLHTSRIPPTIKKKRRRKFFGHFTIIEVIIMTIGTLITAAVIFLILELY
jgi:pSer/pThr/pTyr-binding forkhead associated (FHA) protein